MKTSGEIADEIVSRWMSDQLRAEGRRGIYIDDEACLIHEIQEALQAERDSRDAYKMGYRHGEEGLNKLICESDGKMEFWNNSRVADAMISAETVFRLATERAVEMARARGVPHQNDLRDIYIVGFRRAESLRAATSVASLWPSEEAWMVELEKEKGMYLDCEVMSFENLWRAALNRLRAKILGGG